MTILIIEDNIDILEFLTQAFQDEGFTVDTAIDGSVGLCKARYCNYDIIILDHNLPYKTGGEICALLRQENNSARILMLSVVQSIQNKITTLSAGADDYMTKPFLFGELLARVRALLRRPSEMICTKLNHEDLVIDTSKHYVAHRGKEIALTPKEFLLLEYLVRNHGYVVSRMAILEHVWGRQSNMFGNTVETHILNLRKKLGDQIHKKFIHTIPGVGYKII